MNEERKIQLPANMPPSPVISPQPLPEDIKMTDVEEENLDTDEDATIDTDESPHLGRSLRKGMDRAADRKRKREEQREKREKADAEAKLPKQSKQFTKLLKDIQKKVDAIKDAEEEIAICDNDLREADCPRTRVLGKDRFWNRYYWFERNGMPYGGLPDSSTAEAEYANGRLWVQGPDDLEREGFIDMKPEWQNEYQMRFNITVPERRKMEEGPTSVFNARQWGYYEDPEELDALISWLDVRGINELKLHKELKLYRDRIVRNMEKRKLYLAPEDKSEEMTGDSLKRISTRKKEHTPNTTYRSLLWRNNTALSELGHLHSDPPRARKPAKKAAPILPPPIVEEERVTRSEAKPKKETGRARKKKARWDD